MKTRRLWLSALLGASLCLLGFSGCGSSNGGFVFNNTIVPQPQPEPEPEPVPDPPVANADTFVALGNGTLNQSAANGVLQNDIVNGATLAPFSGTTTSGGTVNLAADGSFTYTPAAGFLGTDRFEYTLTNASGSSTTTVAILVSKRGLFVDTNAAVNGDGSQASPFDNIVDAFAAAFAGDTVFVFSGSTITGPLDVKQGVNLVGQGTGLVLSQTIVEPGTAPTLVGPITPLDNTVITGFRIAGSPSQGITRTNPFNVTIRSNEFASNTNEHIYLNLIRGGVFLESNTFQDPAAGEQAIQIDHTGGNQTVEISIDGNTFNSNGSASLGPAISIVTPNSERHQYRITGNTITGTNNANSYSEGIFVDSFGFVTADLTITDNTITRMQNFGIRLYDHSAAVINADVFNNIVSESGQSNLYTRSENGSLNSIYNIFGNTLSNSTDDGTRVESLSGSSPRVVYSGNTVSGNADDGLYVFRQFGGDGLILVQGNSFSGNGGDGFEHLSTQAALSMLFGVRDNMFSGSGEDDVQFTSDLGSNVCLDVTGNTFNANLNLITTNGGNINVERLSQGLEMFNTFVSGSVTTSGTITPANAGDCNVI